MTIYLVIDLGNGHQENIPLNFKGFLPQVGEEIFHARRDRVETLKVTKINHHWFTEQGVTEGITNIYVEKLEIP